jgi:hypothetical protein
MSTGVFCRKALLLICFTTNLPHVAHEMTPHVQSRGACQVIRWIYEDYHTGQIANV